MSRLTFLVLLPLFPAGLSGQPATRDSAGIHIITSTAPRWTAATTWTVSPKPIRVIGGAGSPESEFGGVIAIARLSDGRIVVGDRSNGRLMFFKPDGSHLGTTGRRGEGPGEFDDIAQILVFPGDTIGVPSFRRQFQLFSPEGRYLRPLPLPTQPLGPIQLPLGVLGVWPDGTVLAIDQPRGLSTDPRTGIWTDSLTVVLVRAGGSERIAKLPFVTMSREPNARGPLRIQFGPAAWPAIGPRGFCHGFAVTYEIRCFRPTGQLERIIRRPTKLEPVRALHREAFRKWLIELPAEYGQAISPQLKAQRTQIANATQFATTFPAFRSVQVDLTGHLWVRAHSVAEELRRPREGGRSMSFPEAPTSWSIFDPAGHWLGDLTLPAQFEPRIFDWDQVVGLGRDPDDVDQVWVFGLDRKAATK